jgi:hypothetical protein
MLINSKDTFQVDVAEKLIPGKGEITKIASVPEARLRVNKSQELQTISRLGWFKSEDNKKLNDLDVFKKNIIVK